MMYANFTAGHTMHISSVDEPHKRRVVVEYKRRDASIHLRNPIGAPTTFSLTVNKAQATHLWHALGQILENWERDDEAARELRERTAEDLRVLGE